MYTYVYFVLRKEGAHINTLKTYKIPVLTILLLVVTKGFLKNKCLYVHLIFVGKMCVHIMLQKGPIGADPIYYSKLIPEFWVCFS